MKQVAIKSVKKNQTSIEADEVAVLKWIKWLKKDPASKNHPGSQHIVDIQETFTEGDHLNIVMELLEGGSVFELCEKLGALTEEEAFWIFEQMCLAVSFLHTNNICHRDIKLENWMFDSTKTRVVLIDFGFSTTCKPGKKLTKRCGSFNYIAPEIVCGLLYDGKQVDMWALGCILFSLLAGYPPFCYNEEEGNHTAFEQIASGNYDDLPKTISSSARNLIDHLLTVSPKTRITIEEVLEHPWMQR